MCLVEGYRKTIEWILITLTARGRLVDSRWIDHPDEEEEISSPDEKLFVTSNDEPCDGPLNF
jgi:hypothetical protein